MERGRTGPFRLGSSTSVPAVNSRNDRASTDSTSSGTSTPIQPRTSGPTIMPMTNSSTIDGTRTFGINEEMIGDTKAMITTPMKLAKPGSSIRPHRTQPTGGHRRRLRQWGGMKGGNPPSGPARRRLMARPVTDVGTTRSQRSRSPGAHGCSGAEPACSRSCRRSPRSPDLARAHSSPSRPPCRCRRPRTPLDPPAALPASRGTGTEHDRVIVDGMVHGDARWPRRRARSRLDRPAAAARSFQQTSRSRSSTQTTAGVSHRPTPQSRDVGHGTVVHRVPSARDGLEDLEAHDGSMPMALPRPRRPRARRPGGAIVRRSGRPSLSRTRVPSVPERSSLMAASGRLRSRFSHHRPRTVAWVRAEGSPVQDQRHVRASVAVPGEGCSTLPRPSPERDAAGSPSCEEVRS